MIIFHIEIQPIFTNFRIIFKLAGNSFLLVKFEKMQIDSI